MVGTKLAGRYKLEERIAVGGMGAVWVATDERLGRRVAVKQLKDDLATNPSFVERFRREARAVAALSHPNIAGVFDYGEDDGRHFIVMELVAGRDLARLLREDGPPDADRAAALAAQVCDALAHAHAAGVVHRDIKPANVIVSPDDHVKVTDFGIARAVGDITLTATGSVLGTAHYISPEQASGDSIGPPSDVYSSGVLLYEMLTGSLPFTGDSPIVVAMRHVSDDVPPPSERTPSVPSHLDAIVARATAKRPEDRFGDASEMAAALRGAIPPATTPVLGGAPTRDLDQTVWPIPGTRWDPARIGRIVILALLALAVLAAALLLWRLTSNDDERRPRRAGGPVAPAPVETTTPTPAESEPVTVTLPSVEDQDEKTAEEQLEALGLEVQEEDVPGPKDIVVDMNPPAGSEVAPGSTVTLFVGEGEEEEKEEKDEEDDDGPGHGNGPPPGKGKDKD